MNIQSAYIMLSESCNLKCEYCFEFRKQNQLMSIETLVDSISYIHKNNIGTVILFGGEPTLNKDGLIYSLRNLNENINVILITNGLYVDDDILEEIRNRKNIVVQVSLDGNYSSMKKRVDSYEQFQTIVNNSKKYSKVVPSERFFYHITITKDTIQSIYENVLFLLSLKTTLNINYTLNINENYSELDALTFKNQLHLVKEYILSCDEEPIIRGINSNVDFVKTSCICYAANASININSKGEIYPCSRLYTNFKERFKIGDIYNGITRKINFKSDKCTKCETCSENECIRCYSANLELSGQENVVNEHYCKMQKVNNEIKKMYRLEKEKSIYNLRGNKIKNLQLIITKDCNFKCEYCFSNNTKKVIDIDNLVKISNLIIKNHDENTIVNFFGGEPMMEYDNIIVPFVENLMYRNYKGKFSIITNGSLLNEQIIDHLYNNRFGIMISIDGDFETFKKNRNANIEVYNAILKNIKYIVDNNYDNFEVRLTYRQDDICRLFDNVKFLHQLGIKRVQIYHEYDININDSKQALFNEFEKLIIYYSKNKDLKIYFLDRVLHYYFNKDKYKRPTTSKCGLINIDNFSFSINYDGSIFTCHHFNSENEDYSSFKIGDLDTGIDFKKVESLQIQNLKNKEIDKYNQRELICSKCKLYDLCSGICIMQNLKLNKSIFENDKTACTINQILYEVIEQLIP